MKPPKVLLFISVCLALLGLIAFAFPIDGIDLWGKNYRFIPLSDLFSTEKTDVIDVEALLKAREDSLKASMNALKFEDSLKQSAPNPMHLQYGKEYPNGMDNFFDALYKRQQGIGNVRIIHYGDSQIEEDRITGYVRAKLQAKFGGGGVGLLSASNITSSYGINQSFSENWTRYTAFGNTSGSIDGRYGAMAIMCKYNLAVTDSTDTVVVQRTFRSGSLTLSRRAGSAASNSNYNVVRIFMGHNKDSVTVKISYNGITDKQVVPPNESLQIITFQLSAIPNQLRITFDGFRTPEVYGISLERPNGVLVDNIPMRGCSGTIFYKLNYLLTNQMYQALDPNLFILQYGGNVMPYLQSKNEVTRFVEGFKSNILRIKNMCPNASFLVIGPADMSKRIAGKMQTYPILPFVRDELKRIVQELGGAYFDMYEVMGGKNSMPSWVDANPPLAAKDYIHFSPRGASKIAELFYEALMLDYEAYLIRTGKKIQK